MAPVRFSYPFYQPPGKQAGPYIPIQFVNPATGLDFIWHCLIDTGASSCLITKPIAEITGHNFKGKSVKSSVTLGVEGNTIETWLHSFTMALLHPEDEKTVVWRSGTQLIECVEHDLMPQLLGQENFLCNFIVTIDYLSLTTTLEWQMPQKKKLKK